MSLTLYDLGRRCVRALRWRWLPGMLDTHGHRILTVDAGGTPSAWAVERYGEPRIIHYQPFMGDLWTRCAPDLSDAATLGAIEDLIRQRYGDAGPPAHAAPRQPRGRRFWILWVPDARAHLGYREAARATTRAEVLTVALEGAP